MFDNWNCLKSLSAIHFHHQLFNLQYIISWPCCIVVDHILLVCRNPGLPHVSLNQNCSHRPIKGERWVPLDALHNYHETHDFLRHCWLCPLLRMQRRIQHGWFMEAAIHIPVSGLYAEEYITECAKSKCGYLGLFISSNWGENLIIYLLSAIGEILYQIQGLCQEILSERFVAKSCSHSSMRVLKSNKKLCLHHSKVSQGSQRPRALKRTYAIAGEWEYPVYICYSMQWQI